MFWIEPALERITTLLKEQDKTDKDLIDYLGLSNGIFTKWRHKNGKSYFKHIEKIAKFLGVTPGYLLRGDDDITYSSLTAQEVHLLQMYRNLDNTGQYCIMTVIDRLVQALENNSK